MSDEFDNMTRLGLALKEYRIHHKLTQTAMARRVGVSTNTIHVWETSRCKPGMGSMVVLSEMLDEPLMEIVVMAKSSYALLG